MGQHIQKSKSEGKTAPFPHLPLRRGFGSYLKLCPAYFKEGAVSREDVLTWNDWPTPVLDIYVGYLTGSFFFLSR